MKKPKYVFGGVEGNDLKSVASAIVNDNQPDSLRDLCHEIGAQLDAATMSDTPDPVMECAKAIYERAINATDDPSVEEGLKIVSSIIRERLCCHMDTDANGNLVFPGMTLYLMPDRDGATEADMETIYVDQKRRYCWHTTREAALDAARRKLEKA